MFREFNCLVRRLFAEGPLPRLDFEEPLFGLLRNAFCVRFRLGSRLPGVFDHLLPPLEVLIASCDPVDVSPDFLFLLFQFDLPRLDPHHPIRPRGSRGGSLLLECVPLVLQQGLLGLQGRLPGPSLLRRFRLLVSKASPLPLEFVCEGCEVRLPAIQVAADLVRFCRLDFQRFVLGRQFREATCVLLRLRANGVLLLSKGLFAGFQLDLSGENRLALFGALGLEGLILLRQMELTLTQRLRLPIEVVATPARFLVVLGSAFLEFLSIRLERTPRFLDDHAVLLERHFPRAQVLLLSIERLRPRREPILVAPELRLFLGKGIRSLRESYLVGRDASLPRREFLRQLLHRGLPLFYGADPAVDGALELEELSLIRLELLTAACQLRLISIEGFFAAPGLVQPPLDGGRLGGEAFHRVL